MTVWNSCFHSALGIRQQLRIYSNVCLDFIGYSFMQRLGHTCFQKWHHNFLLEVFQAFHSSLIFSSYFFPAPVYLSSFVTISLWSYFNYKCNYSLFTTVQCLLVRLVFSVCVCVEEYGQWKTRDGLFQEGEIGTEQDILILLGQKPITWSEGLHFILASTFDVKLENLLQFLDHNVLLSVKWVLKMTICS